MKIGCHLPMFGPVATRENVLTFARRMEALGYEVSGDGPAEYAAFLKTEIEKWAKVAKAAGIKPE